MALDTVANVKVGLAVSGTADDALLARLQAAADSFIADHCGRVFGGGTFTERNPGGGALVFLQNYPVASVTDIRVDPARGFAADTVMSSDRYVVYPARGVVECPDGSFVPRLAGWGRADAFPDAVQVTYAVATGGVPAAVSQAYADLIGYWFRQAKTHDHTGQLNLVQETPDGAGGPTVYPFGQSSGFRVPAAVKELLAAYRVPPLG